MMLTTSKLLFSAIFLTAVSSSAVHAQKVVDPSTVAPEFREAAEKRRAEQLKQILCNKAARDQKIAPRDVLKFVTDCFDKPDDKPTDISASRPTAPDAASATPK
jgi:hypothetical protein